MNESIELALQYPAVIGGVAVCIALACLLAIRARKRSSVRTKLPDSHQDVASVRAYIRAEKLRDAGKFEESANHYLQAGLNQRALDLWERSESYAKLAEYSAQQGDMSAAGQWYMRAGDTQQAIAAYEQANCWIDVAKIYGEQGNHVAAASAWGNAGDPQNQALHLSHAGDWRQARSVLAQAVDGQRYAAIVYDHLTTMLRGSQQIDVNDVNWELANRGARDSEQWQQLREMAGYCGHWADAALACEKLGQSSEAVQLYRRAKMFSQSARLLGEQGQPAEAELDLAHHYEQEEDLESAAHHYRQAGNNEKAVEVLQNAGLFLDAAEILLNIGECQSAGELFERESEFSQAGYAFLQADLTLDAARCFALTDERVRAANLYLQVEEYKLAGDNFARAGMEDEAVKAYQRHIRREPDDIDTVLRLVELFEQKGMLNSAAESINTLIGGRPVTDTTIEWYYKLARIRERMNEHVVAKRILEKILAFDLAYEDASDRIRNLERMDTLDKIGASASQGSQSQGNQRYRIERELGQGGMGSVYLATDTVLGRKVALKVLKTDQMASDAIDRMLEEAKIAARLNHDNIVTVFDVSMIDGSVFLSMELVEGQTLHEIIAEQGAMPWVPFLLIFGQACQGLQYAHKEGVIHRDIKPANLMWTPDRKLKIMDFGLAVAMLEMSNSQTMIAGTPHYMAPEQVIGDPVDQRTDLYALGVTMFESIAGKRPFSGGDVGYHHIHTKAPLVSTLRDDVPPRIAAMVDRCLHKAPAERFPDAEALLAEIKIVMSELKK